MKIARMMVGVGAALLGIASTAQAAPKVSGKYSLMIFTQCEARITTTNSNPVNSVNPSQSGGLSVGVGSLTFPAAAASSGSARLEVVIIGGGSLRLNNSGNAMAGHTEAPVGTFLAADASFRFDPTGAEPAMTWIARYGNIVSGVARTIYLVRREDARCVNAITATRQAP